MKKSKRFILRALFWILFIIYLILMVYFLFFSEQLGRTPSDTYHYNLEPFAEINRYRNNIDKIGYYGVILNLFGNVVCFVPLGFVLPILSNYKLKFIRVTLISLLASISVEIIQLITKLGSCDVDDVILNTCGGLAGYILFYITNKIYRNSVRKKRKK